MELDLSGRTAIVTGSGRGIGQVIATSLAEAGANVVAAARSTDEIEGTVQAVEDLGVEGLAVTTDLSNEDDITTLVDRATDVFGTPEILINNAAANLAAPPLDQSTDEVDMMLDVNLRGLFLLSQRWAQAFRESPADSGRIVNIASVAAHVGVPAMTVYGGSKSGIFGITQGLAADLAGDGITVNSISPGLVLVQRVEDVLEARGELFDLDRIPVDRIGEPEDVANLCVFLSSDLASYITGEDILVDGGVSFTAGLYK